MFTAKGLVVLIAVVAAAAIVPAGAAADCVGDCNAQYTPPIQQILANLQFKADNLADLSDIYQELQFVLADVQQQYAAALANCGGNPQCIADADAAYLPQIAQLQSQLAQIEDNIQACQDDINDLQQQLAALQAALNACIQDCTVPTEKSTWGAIKALYR